MTDLQRFIELYKSVGIELAAHSISTKQHYPIDGFALILIAKSHPQVEGYNGFETAIYFNPDGSFNHQDIYE